MDFTAEMDKEFSFVEDDIVYVCGILLLLEENKITDPFRKRLAEEFARYVRHVVARYQDAIEPEDMR